MRLFLGQAKKRPAPPVSGPFVSFRLPKKHKPLKFISYSLSRRLITQPRAAANRILGAVKNRIWSFASSILQADNEGFSNEDGYHILWQFSDSVDGDWSMGVLQDGRWKHFQMDLGNRKQRESFFQGQIPDDAKLA